MKLFKKTVLSTLIGMTVVAGSAQAGPKPGDIGRLSTDLTPVGAVRAGNATGRSRPAGLHRRREAR